ncbi:MAG: M24 family metallopeptidase [Rhodothermales bacterium]
MRKQAWTTVFLIFLFLPMPAAAQQNMPVILSMRERATVVDDWLMDRLENVVPQLMRRNGIDMWIVSAREYNEDPVIRSMLPATWIAARRRTILVFFDHGEEKGVERIAVARYDIGEFFPSGWKPEQEPDQWARLAEIITIAKPNKIALNRSTTFGLADGLTDAEFDGLHKALPAAYQDRIVSGENLAIGWLETRTAAEMEVYPMICKIAHEIISEGLSEQVIQPGITSTSDVEWWYRERIRALKLVTWFHPSVSIQRDDATEARNSFSSKADADVIRPGDLIHVDFGITYLRLNTDTQQHAYILKPGETDAPAGLKNALKTGNRLQDILTSHFGEGRTGNEILADTRKQAIAEGITPSIYTHPIGFQGHGAGPTIGLWDQQGGVAGRGDYPMFANTAYSIELNASVPIPEWNNKNVRIMLEEDAFFDGSSTWYIDGRQTSLWLIPRSHPVNK